jgi:hypothetical protein
MKRGQFTEEQIIGIGADNRHPQRGRSRPESDGGLSQVRSKLGYIPAVEERIRWVRSVPDEEAAPA